MAESELLCVRVANLVRNKYASILRVISQGVVRIVKILFYCSRYLPSLTTSQEKNIAIALAITLVRAS